MRRTGGGLAALERARDSQRSYASLSSELERTQIAALQTQLASFRSALQAFADAHRKDIRDDPRLRRAFAQMCAQIGVDPLAGPRRGGWWAELLGTGDWAHELAVQVVDVCVSTRARNGGLIALPELARILRALRRVSLAELPEDDVVDAIKALKVLGAGYEIIDAGGTRMVRSVVRELDADQAVVLGFAQDVGGRVTEHALVAQTGWTRDRARAALENMLVRDALCWLDDQDHECGRAYYVPSTMRWED
jgi:ESCRT-II complex subunit VPS22